MRAQQLETRCRRGTKISNLVVTASPTLHLAVGDFAASRRIRQSMRGGVLEIERGQ